MGIVAKEKHIKNFTKGLYTRLESESIPDGAASDSLNWMSLGDRIELRRGQTLMGTDVEGDGRVTGLKVGTRFDGTEVPFHSAGKKIKYYNELTGDWVEVSTADVLGYSADGEDVAFDQYHSLAGAFVYASSKNSGAFKIPIANPGSIVDLSVTSHRGKFRIKQNRTFLWDRKDTSGGFDETGVFGSYVDKDELSDYSSVTGESIGSSGSTGYSGTLLFRTPTFTVTIASPGVFTSTAHKLLAGDPVVFSTDGSLPTGLVAGTTYYVIATGLTADAFRVSATVGGAAINTSGSQSGTHRFTATKRTCMYVSISATVDAGTEIFRDDRNGNLVSNFGGTGTINYATGAYSVTFSSATTGSVTADYYWEDSTSTGVFDFSKSTPRSAGQGFVFRQDDAGADMQNIFSLGSDEYCMHTLKTYVLHLSADDTAATNLIYRNRVGIPYWRAGCESGDGIYYVDAQNNSEPFISILEIGVNNAEVVPRSLSDQLNLTGYSFDMAVVFEWGLYLCVACRSNGSTINDTLFMRHKLWKCWDKFDFRVSCLDTYNGALIAGDSGSSNVFKLFDGFTDEDVEIPNHWISKKDNLGMEGEKYANLMVVKGLIADDQELEVWQSYNEGDFVLVKTISGTGDYVDHNQRVDVGSTTLGQVEVGGGGTGVEASPFRVEFRINSPKFENVRTKFVATKVGYVSVSEFGHKDIRFKGRSLPSQYVAD